MSKKPLDPTTAHDLFAMKLTDSAKAIGGNPGVALLATTYGLPADEKEIIAVHEAGDITLRRAMATTLSTTMPSVLARLWLSNYLTLAQSDERMLVDRDAAASAGLRTMRDNNRARVTGLQQPGRVVGQDRAGFDQTLDTVVEAQAIIGEIRRLTGWPVSTIRTLYVALHTLEDGHFEALDRVGGA